MAFLIIGELPERAYYSTLYPLHITLYFTSSKSLPLGGVGEGSSCIDPADEASGELDNIEADFGENLGGRFAAETRLAVDGKSLVLVELGKNLLLEVGHVEVYVDGSRNVFFGKFVGWAYVQKFYVVVLKDFLKTVHRQTSLLLFLGAIKEIA